MNTITVAHEASSFGARLRRARWERKRKHFPHRTVFGIVGSALLTRPERVVSLTVV